MIFLMASLIVCCQDFEFDQFMVSSLVLMKVLHLEHRFEAKHLFVQTNQQNDSRSEINVSASKNYMLSDLSHDRLTVYITSNKYCDNKTVNYNGRFASCTSKKKDSPRFKKNHQLMQQNQKIITTERSTSWSPRMQQSRPYHTLDWLVTVLLNNKVTRN